jgi:hypothetical protein
MPAAREVPCSTMLHRQTPSECVSHGTGTILGRSPDETRHQDGEIPRCANATDATARGTASTAYSIKPSRMPRKQPTLRARRPPTSRSGRSCRCCSARLAPRSAAICVTILQSTARCQHLHADRSAKGQNASRGCGTKVRWEGFIRRTIPSGSNQAEATMPVILWLLGVPLVVVVALMLTHVI